ncbi:zinc-dependent peptidase [Aquimarina agarivorans]|uniref:M90 family metallopeptidase n=1 Tax=Aquimarina agarivorans TaxID=980584 RepID=UPI000248ED35|nr:M90 family metallopeptidase [Aquimarina agarivorans]
MIYIITIAVIAGILFAILYKKKPVEIETPPKHWHQILDTHVLYYHKLTPSEQHLFQQKMIDFLSYITIEGVQLTLEDKDRILVAASGIIPIFKFDHWRYPNLNTVLLYPDYFNEDLEFNASAEGKKIAGLVGTGRFKNQMILSKKALYHGFSNKTDKNNTAVHEFVHLLDKLDGATDGIPERLLEQENILPWLHIMHSKMEAINNYNSDIRNYGGTSQTEFFAVAAEYFFERPQLLEQKHPDLYQMLLKCFSKRE